MKAAKASIMIGRMPVSFSHARHGTTTSMHQDHC